MVFVPRAHHLVHAATVHAAGQVAHLLGEVTKERGTRRKFLVVNIAVQGLVQSEDEPRHATKSPSQVLQNSLSRGYAEVRLGTNFAPLCRCSPFARTRLTPATKPGDSDPMPSVFRGGFIEHQS